MGFYLMSYGKLCVQRKNGSEIIMLELFFLGENYAWT